MALLEPADLLPPERDPCQSCGSSARLCRVSIAAAAIARSKLGMKGKHAGGGKPFVEMVSGDDPHRKSGKWMKLSRVIDREHDQDSETVMDP